MNNANPSKLNLAQPTAKVSNPPNLDEALAYRARGWPIIPVHPNSKLPLVKWRPYQDQLPTEAEVRQWWAQWTKARIGMPTGHLSWMLVLDCDSEEATRRFLESYPGAEGTLQVETGRGRHFYFAWEEGVRTGVGTLGTGIDVRSEGGFVILPPSLHSNGKRYRWLNDFKPLPLPQGLKEVLLKSNGNRGSTKGGTDVERIKEGERNNTLFSKGCAMRRKGMSYGDIFAALKEMNSTACDPPLSEGEVQVIARSAAGYTPTEGQPYKREKENQQKMNTPTSLNDVEDALRRLASTLDGADPLRRSIVREAAVDKLGGLGIRSPAQIVDAALQSGQHGVPNQQQGRPVLFDDPEPWPELVDGSALLDEIVTILKRFIVFPSSAAEAVALWIVHTHALEAFSISPLLAITSPTKRSGKTLLLEVISCLLVRSLHTSNITPATLFRCVDKYTPSLLIDEADSFLKDNEELRGILNASHRKASSFIMRTVGEDHEPTLFTTWCPKAIALIGKLPGTLEDRSIIVSLRRKSPSEQVERFVVDKMSHELTTTKRKLMRWTADNLDALRKADPVVQATLNDRAADNWRPLLAVADLVGGQWALRASAASQEFGELADEGDNTASIQLLADLRDLFDGWGVDKLPSTEICQALARMEDRPWPEWRQGKPITTRQLASLLKPFGVFPIRNEEGGRVRGYDQKALLDPLSRYLPPKHLSICPSPIESRGYVDFDLSQIGTTDRYENELRLVGSLEWAKSSSFLPPRGHFLLGG